MLAVGFTGWVREPPRMLYPKAATRDLQLARIMNRANPQPATRNPQLATRELPAMSKWNSVAILGVGLIGGSIGLALRRGGLADHVTGIGRSQSRLRNARKQGAVTSTTTAVARGVADAELVIVCTPVDHIVDHVRQVAAACHPGTLITDVGSTKERIVAELAGSLPRGVRFVGSHPMAGSEQVGCEHARPDLFAGRVVAVTPRGADRSGAASRIADFWTSLGAEVIRLAPRVHDRAVASTSHLPHVVASALAATLAEKDQPLAATGWRDTTRIAAGDVEMWKQILLDNRGHVLKSIDKFEKVLDSLRLALEQENERRLTRILQAGKTNRDALGS